MGWGWVGSAAWGGGPAERAGLASRCLPQLLLLEGAPGASPRRCCLPWRSLTAPAHGTGADGCAAAGHWLQVRVCVIDTGARQTHEDLRANIVGGWNRWGCSRRCGGTPETQSHPQPAAAHRLLPGFPASAHRLPARLPSIVPFACRQHPGASAAAVLCLSQPAAPAPRAAPRSLQGGDGSQPGTSPQGLPSPGQLPPEPTPTGRLFLSFLSGRRPTVCSPRPGPPPTSTSLTRSGTAPTRPASSGLGATTASGWRA